MGEYLLETQGISKSFSTVKVLSDINLKIRKGEIHALLGENGAGKSTLMKILTGVLEADEGTILYRGKPLKINHQGKSMTMESELSIRNLIFFRI